VSISHTHMLPPMRSPHAVLWRYLSQREKAIKSLSHLYVLYVAHGSLTQVDVLGEARSSHSLYAGAALSYVLRMRITK